MKGIWFKAHLINRNFEGSILFCALHISWKYVTSFEVGFISLVSFFTIKLVVTVSFGQANTTENCFTMKHFYGYYSRCNVRVVEVKYSPGFPLLHFTRTSWQTTYITYKQISIAEIITHWFKVTDFSNRDS